MSFPSLVAGCLLLALAQTASAQTLADIRSLMRQGEMPRALEQAERYIAAQPKDVQGLFAKGLILSEMGRLKEAIALFTDLTERFPELPEPYNNLAVLHARQKQYDKAQAALEMAIRAHPSYVIAHENLGDIYVKLAALAYDRALQLNAPGPTVRAKLEQIGKLIGLSASGQAPANPEPLEPKEKP
jgi:tetratricopeptide (TPR) repeat protein